MKKLLAVISLAFVVGVGVHAQQSKTVIETLKQGKPKAAQTEQANSTEPLLAFRIYEKGIIFSAQGQPDQTCEWTDQGRVKFTELIVIEMKAGEGIRLGGQHDALGFPWHSANTRSCTFKSTPKSLD